MAINSNATEVQSRLNIWRGRFPAAIKTGFTKARQPLINMIREDYLTGQVLGVVTGNLRRSIRGIIEISDGDVQMRVGSSHTADGFSYGRYWHDKGRNFLNPAINRSMNNITRMIKNELMSAYPKGGM